MTLVTDQQIANTQILEHEVVPAVDREAVVAEAVSIIDEALARTMQRDLVSSVEVADLLLDLRSLLTAK